MDPIYLNDNANLSVIMDFNTLPSWNTPYTMCPILWTACSHLEDLDSTTGSPSYPLKRCAPHLIN